MAKVENLKKRIAIDVSGKPQELRERLARFIIDRGFMRDDKYLISVVTRPDNVSVFFGPNKYNGVSKSGETLEYFKANSDEKYRYTTIEALLDIPDDVGIDKGLKMSEIKTIRL